MTLKELTAATAMKRRLNLRECFVHYRTHISFDELLQHLYDEHVEVDEDKIVEQVYSNYAHVIDEADLDYELIEAKAELAIKREQDKLVEFLLMKHYSMTLKEFREASSKEHMQEIELMAEQLKARECRFHHGVHFKTYALLIDHFRVDHEMVDDDDINCFFCNHYGKSLEEVLALDVNERKTEGSR